MAVLPIRQVPDPVLRAVAAPVTEFDADLAALAADMFETMYAAPGRGLAAPQVGVSLRLFVTDTTWKEGTRTPRVFVNPTIHDASAETSAYDEGCLSIPDRLTEVVRPAAITLRWQDLEGGWHEGRFDGFDATCIQHERDHLDGILCTDYAA